MSASTIKAADMLEIQFRKALTKRHVLNATLRHAYSHPAIPIGDAACELKRAGGEPEP